MSLRDDIEALTAAVRRFSCMQDHATSCRRSHEQKAGLMGEENPCQHAERVVNRTPVSEGDISAIPMAAEGDDCDVDPEPAVMQQTTTSLYRSRKVDDDTFAVPPSSNTTALPSAEVSGSRLQRVVGHKFAADASAPVGRVPLHDSRTKLWKPNGSRQDDFSLTTEEAAQCSSIALNGTTVSSGNSTVLQDQLQCRLRQMEEAYKHVARNLLSEIQRLDAQTTTLSRRCEGERQNWQRAQHELEEQLVHRDTLITTLRQQLVDICAGCESASAGGARGSSGSEWTLGQNGGIRHNPTALERRSVKGSRSQSGVGTTSDAYTYDRPIVSSESCGISTSSMAEVFSREGPRRTWEENERAGYAGSPARHGATAEDATSTRPHSITEFVQRRLSSWGTTRLSEDVATQTSNLAMSATPTAVTPLFQPAAEAPTTSSERVVSNSGNMTLRIPMCLTGDAGTLSRNGGCGGSSTGGNQEQRTTSKPAVHHMYENIVKQKSAIIIEDDKSEKERNRTEHRTPVMHAMPRDYRGLYKYPDDDVVSKPSRGCGLYFHNRSGKTARPGPPASHRRASTGNRSVAQRGSNERSATRRSCRAVSLKKTQCGRRKEEQREAREMLHGVVVSNTLMEARLRIFQTRLEKQEMELREITSFFRDVLQPLTVEVQKLRQAAGSA